MRARIRPQAGFTLIEIIMVIVITGIIGGMVAMFLQAPIQQYMDISRRTELTNIADTAFYKMASDISIAVPNSARVAGCGSTPCVEFLPAKDAGRYRADATGSTSLCAAAGDDLDFASADTCFEIVGPSINFVSGDYIVIGSTQSGGAPAYSTATTGVLRAYTGAAGLQSHVTFTATQFPLFAQLDSQRFDVVDATQQAVTFSCEGTLGIDARGDGQASLVKHWSYGFNATQVAPASLGGSRAILADKVSACAIDYDATNQRFGLVGVSLTLTSGGESVTLYNEIHVNNVP